MATQVSERSRHLSHLAVILQERQPPQTTSADIPPIKEFHMSDLETFDETVDKCRGFLLQCGIILVPVLVYAHSPIWIVILSLRLS